MINDQEFEDDSDWVGKLAMLFFLILWVCSRESIIHHHDHHAL